MKKILIITLILVISGGFFNSCKKDHGDPPVVPPSGTMSIDFSNFETGKKGDLLVSIPKGTPNSNWELAAGAALLWKAIIYSTLAVPVYSFQQAAEQKPVYIDDLTWQWDASAILLNVTYKARLTGQITESNVVWKMYITKEGSGGYTDFLWFEGVSELDGTAGTWTLYESQQNPVQIVRIDWTVEGETLGEIKFTYLKAGNPFATSYIEYGLTANPLNAYYNIYYYSTQFDEFFNMNVEWSTTLHNGRVKCPEFFGTESWYCWDNNLLNVTCQ